MEIPKILKSNRETNSFTPFSGTLYTSSTIEIPLTEKKDRETVTSRTPFYRRNTIDTYENLTKK
jgi:hypothetical protein